MTRTTNNYQPRILTRRVLRSTCPYCADTRFKMRLWQFAAIWFAILLVLLLTLHK